MQAVQGCQGEATRVVQRGDGERVQWPEEEAVRVRHQVANREKQEPPGPGSTGRSRGAREVCGRTNAIVHGSRSNMTECYIKVTFILLTVFQATKVYLFW